MDNTSRKILEILQANREKPISGSEIGSIFGISRSAVWKQIGALRSAGYRITARSNYGYRLDNEPDLLDERVTKGSQIVYLPVTDSTNYTARRLAEDHAPTLTTVVADHQTSGRGRLGRNWFSPPASGLWFSILLRPAYLNPAEANPLTLVTAAVIAEYLRADYQLPVQIKWPNDLLLGSKKVAGILTEIKGEPDRIDYLVVGIGLNVNQAAADFPPALKNSATSLFIESGHRFDRSDLFVNLHRELLKAYRIFEDQGFKPFHRNWEKHNITLGHQVTVKWAGGTLTGVADRLTAEGKLVVIDHNGDNQLVNFGELV